MVVLHDLLAHSRPLATNFYPIPGGVSISAHFRPLLMTGHMSCLLIDVESLLSVKVSPPVEILRFQSDIVAQIGIVDMPHSNFDFATGNATSCNERASNGSPVGHNMRMPESGKECAHIYGFWQCISDARINKSAKYKIY
jgi:hypothetical protein